MSTCLGCPEPANPILYSLLAWIRRILLLPRFLVLRHIVLQGTTRDGVTGSELHYIGDGETLNYLKELNFSSVTKQGQSWLPIWNLRRRVNNSIVSGRTVTLEINSMLSRLVPSGGYCMYPWIRQKIFLNGERHRKHRRYIEEVFGRKVRKYRYGLRITQDRRALETFYNTFYVPYITFRYKDDAWVRSHRELRNAMRSGFLLQVYEGERWISGGVCRLKKGEIVTYAFALAPDYAYHLRRGALSAFYYSNSTLDHFSTKKDIMASLKQLNRILKPNKTLLLTLDNPNNPIVFMRNLLPYRLLKAVGLIPYAMGKTMSKSELIAALQANGYKIIDSTHIDHSPRLAVILASCILEKFGNERWRNRIYRWVHGCERLEKTRISSWTGYFIAINAVKVEIEAASPQPGRTNKRMNHMKKKVEGSNCFSSSAYFDAVPSLTPL